MASLDRTPLSGTAAVDAAIRSCSGFDGFDGLIDSMLDDCSSATDRDEFLRECCGIDLDNEDTGSITGLDAGGSTVKTKDSIVEESGESEYPSENFFEIDGLTVYVPDRSSLTEKQQAIVRGLYSWWIGGALELIEESYGENFSFGSSGSASVKEITLEFVDSGSILAQVGHRYRNSSGKATRLLLQVNMKYYDALNVDDVNGSTRSVSGSYLDRVLAHEMTHAVMAANVNNFAQLPACIKEGLAELTHGIDDTRRSAIRSLAANPTKFRAALSDSINTVNIFGITGASYAAGYILLRYLAKQAAPTIETRTSDLAYVELTEVDDTLALYENDLTIAAGAGDDSIHNQAEGITIIGGLGNDTLNRAELYRYSGGADVITSYSTGDTIQLIDAAFNRRKVSDSNVIIDTTNGSITLKNAVGKDIFIVDAAGDSIDLDNIIGTEGADSIVNEDDDVMISVGAGDDTIRNYGSNVTIRAGEGDDLIYDLGSNNAIELDGALENFSIDGNDLIVELDNGSITLDGAARSKTKLNRSKTKLTVGDPFAGLIDCADLSKLKTIDARKNSNALSIVGNEKNNILRAGSGGCTLAGGLGNDKLYGGAGADVFVFDGRGRDMIYNLDVDDRIAVEDEIEKIMISGKNVKFVCDAGTLTIKKAVGVELALTDSDGETNRYVFDRTHKTLETARV